MSTLRAALLLLQLMIVCVATPMYGQYVPAYGQDSLVLEEFASFVQGCADSSGRSNGRALSLGNEPVRYRMRYVTRRGFSVVHFPGRDQSEEFLQHRDPSRRVARIEGAITIDPSPITADRPIEIAGRQFPIDTTPSAPMVYVDAPSILLGCLIDRSATFVSYCEGKRLSVKTRSIWQHGSQTSSGSECEYFLERIDEQKIDQDSLLRSGIDRFLREMTSYPSDSLPPDDSIVRYTFLYSTRSSSDYGPDPRNPGPDSFPFPSSQASSISLPPADSTVGKRESEMTDYSGPFLRYMPDSLYHFRQRGIAMRGKGEIIIDYRGESDSLIRARQDLRDRRRMVLGRELEEPFPPYAEPEPLGTLHLLTECSCDSLRKEPVPRLPILTCRSDLQRDGVWSGARIYFSAFEDPAVNYDFQFSGTGRIGAIISSNNGEYLVVRFRQTMPLSTAFTIREVETTLYMKRLE